MNDKTFDKELQDALSAPINVDEFCSGIVEGLDEISGIILYEAIQDLLPSNLKLYYNEGATEDYAAYNVKGRGCWNFDKIRKGIAEKKGIDIKTVEAVLSDRELREIWEADVDDFFDTLHGIARGSVERMGRSGGWWGVCLDSYANSDIVRVDPSFFNSFFDSPSWKKAIGYFLTICEEFDYSECGDSLAKQFGKVFVSVYGIDAIKDSFFLNGYFEDDLSIFSEEIESAILVNEESGNTIIDGIIERFFQ